MPELPSGTVTFLFTDIEGSTKLLDEIGQGSYAEALAEHRRALREAFARHGGVEVGTEGDSFFVAFPTAPGAVAAARDGQEELAGGPVRVRMGVHTGTPLITEEGYVGADVHRAARVAACGHGGQVLVTEATRTLAGPDFTLVDLGPHRLKDLGAALRIYQLGTGEFPALRSLGRTNLPVQPTPFFGRERELTEVVALIRDPDLRLLTLTGAGGSGKTRLALQTAAECAQDYEHGVFWVPLASVRDPGLVLEAVAQALGTHDIAEYVADRSLLLVLDNFEHVVNAAGDLADLLSGSPSLTAVVTSREPLRVAAEREYPVPPLVRDEAVEFFIERAKVADPGFAGDDSVAEICRRLDDLPLALELAAARVRALSPQQLLSRLDERLLLLTSRRRDAPERQRTLRDTIAWSYDLLDEEEQVLLARVSVFAGGCTLEAAEEVCAADIDTLQSLVEKSLIRFAHDRYSLLETIREFAAECLAATDEEDALRRAHAARFLPLAEELEGELAGPGRSRALDRLELEHDNLRAALRFLRRDDPRTALRLAASLWPFWLARGFLGEGRRWLADALEAGRDATDLTRARALTGAGILAHYQGDYAEAEALCAEGLELSRRAGDAVAAGAALTGLALAARTRGDHAEAARRYGEAVELFREVGDTSRLAYTLDRFGIALWFHGDDDRARELMEESLAIFRELGDAEGIGLALLDLGFIALTHENIEEAAPLLAESLALSREVGDRRTVAKALYANGDLARSRGEHTAAAALYEECLAMFLELGDRWFTARTLERLGGLFVETGQAERAAQLFGASDALRAATSESMPAYVLTGYERDVARARTLVDEKAFAAAWEVGRRLTPGDVLDITRAPGTPAASA